MIDISILSTKRIFLRLPLTLMYLAIACSRNVPLATQNESPDSLAQDYRLSKDYRWSERQLTSDELTQSLSQLNQDIEKNRDNPAVGKLYQDRRTHQQKKSINSYIQAWASVDPDIAPFLGQRRIIHSSFIYPSLKKGTVCIIENIYVSPSEFGALFSSGNVKNGILETSTDKTIIARNGLLAVISIRENKPQFSLLPHALPLEAPEVQGNPDILTQFQASQCQFTAPS